MKSRFKAVRHLAAESKSDSGFTLIELLIVVLILGILAAIVVFALGTFTSTSAQAACNTDAKSVESAVGAYDASQGSEPTNLASLTTTTNGGPYLRTAPNSKYYTISIVGSTGGVDVALAAGDPGDYTTPTGGPGTGAVDFDTYTFPAGAPGSLATENICAGA